MATCLDIITRAMIELGVLGIGKTPKAAEAQEGLLRLQQIVDGLWGSGLSESLEDLDVTAAQTLSADTRCLVAVTSPITLTFPESPFNGARVQVKDMTGNFGTYNVTLNGNGRHIEGASTKLLNTNATDTTWVYIAESANWAKVATLLLTDVMPVVDDEFFTLNLAKRLAPIFGAQFGDDVALLRAANRIRAKFASQVVIPCDEAVQYLSRQTWRNGFIGPGNP